MRLVRKVKMSKVTSVIFEDSEKAIIAYLTSKLKGLTHIYFKEYSECEFYINDNQEFIMYFDKHHILQNNKCIFTAYITKCVDYYSDISKNDIIDFIAYIIDDKIKEKYNTSFCKNNIIFEDCEYKNVTELLIEEYKKISINEH